METDTLTAGSSNQLPPGQLSQDVNFFDSQKYGSDQSVASLSQSLIPSSNVALENKSSSQQKADHIPSNIEVMQSSEEEKNDQNVSCSEKSSVIDLHTKSSEQENDVLINSSTLECDVPSGSDDKLPLEHSEHDFSMNLLNNGNVMDSFKDEMDESDYHLHLEHSKNTTIDESGKDEITKTETDAVDQDQIAETKTSEMQTNGATLVGLVKPCVNSCNGTDASKFGNSNQVIDICACLPSLEKMKLYSKRLDEINIQRAVLFRSALPEVQKQILDEVLASLTKTSNQFSVAAEQPNAPIMWTRVITVVARQSGPPQREGTSGGSYSLRRRRNQQPSDCLEMSSVHQDLDDLDDILPDVDIDQHGNDGDWLPALKPTTKKKRPAASAVNKRSGLFGARPRERGVQPQIECQESDDGEDAFDALIKKPFFSSAGKDSNKPSTLASNLIIDQQVSSSSSTSKRKSFSLQLDKALALSPAVKENQRKFQRSNSPVYDPSVELCKTSLGSKDDASSDNDIMEIDVVGSASPSIPSSLSSSHITNSPPKSHPAETMSSSSTPSRSVSSRGHVLAAPLPYLNRAGPSGVIRNSLPGAGLGGRGAVKKGLAPIAGGSGTVASPLQEQRHVQQKRDEEGELLIKPGPLKLRGQLFPGIYFFLLNPKSLLSLLNMSVFLCIILPLVKGQSLYQ